MRRFAVAVALLMSGLVAPRIARADEPKARVELRPGAPQLAYRIQPIRRDEDDEDDENAQWRCSGTCVLHLRPGPYRLELFEHGELVGHRTVRVDGPLAWRVSPPDTTLKWVGLTFGIVGPIVTFIGMVEAFPYAPGMGGDCPGGCPDYSTQERIGWGLFLAGTVATVGGWVAFAHNRGPILDPEAWHPDSGWTSRIRVGAAPAPGGASVAAMVTF